jgi:hypothetical protein
MTTLDRATVALATAASATAVAFAPTVPAVELPADSRADDPAFDGSGGNGALDATRRLSHRVVTAAGNAPLADGVVPAAPTTAAVAAGDAPVALRYQLRAGDRSTNRTVVVPAGEARTVAEPPEFAAGDPPSTVTLRVTATTADGTVTGSSETLGVTAGG